MRPRWPEAVWAVTPAASARSEAVGARPSIKSDSMAARAGSPIRAATSDRAFTVVMVGIYAQPVVASTANVSVTAERSFPLGIGDGDLVGDGGLEVGHQGRIAFVALAGAELAGKLAVEIVERAAAAQQFCQPRPLSGIGVGAEARLAFEDRSEEHTSELPSQSN